VLGDGGAERDISLACLLVGVLQGVVAVVAMPRLYKPIEW
jgi:hypothetical protein